MRSRTRGDLFARIMGFLVFVLGVGVIVGVLWLASEMWRDPNLGLRLPAAAQTAPNLQDVGVGFGQLIIRIALLFLGSLCGSLIANKGINLYFTGLPVRETVEMPAPAVPIEEPRLKNVKS